MAHSTSTAQNGFAVRAFRTCRGLSVDDLSKKTGISTPHVRNIENEHRSASADHLRLIATALELEDAEALTRVHPGRDGEQNGYALRVLRQIRGLSVGELAAAIDVSQPHLRNLEHEHRSASDEHLNRLAHVLDVNVAALRRRSVAQRQLVSA